MLFEFEKCLKLDVKRRANDRGICFKSICSGSGQVPIICHPFNV